MAKQDIKKGTTTTADTKKHVTKSVKSNVVHKTTNKRMSHDDADADRTDDETIEEQYQRNLREFEGISKLLEDNREVTENLKKSMKNVPPSVQTQTKAKINKNIDHLISKKLENFFTSKAFIDSCVFVDQVARKLIPDTTVTAGVAMLGAYAPIGAAVVAGLKIADKAVKTIPYEERLELYELGVKLMTGPLGAFETLLRTQDKNQAANSFYRHLNEVVEASKELFKNSTFLNMMGRKTITHAVEHLLKNGKPLFQSAMEAIKKYVPSMLGRLASGTPEAETSEPGKSGTGMKGIVDFSAKALPVIKQGLEILDQSGLLKSELADKKKAGPNKHK